MPDWDKLRDSTDKPDVYSLYELEEELRNKHLIISGVTSEGLAEAIGEFWELRNVITQEEFVEHISGYLGIY